MKVFVLWILFLATGQKSFCEIKLPRLLRDSMVLQRDVKLKIWGWASPKEIIRLSFLNKKYKTQADANGNWQIRLFPMKAGGPYSMYIDGKNHIRLTDILIGDVWVCSGQSNMVHQMKLHQDRYAEEIANANYPQIRQFFIPTITNLQKSQNDLSTGYWKAANSQNVMDFSAIAYFFAKTIYEKYHVPIGLINASVGGTPVEAWTSGDALKEFPDVAKTIAKNKDTAWVNNINRKAFLINAANDALLKNDKGLTGDKKWYDPSYIPKGWHTINIPGYWEDQGNKELDGTVWYRKEIDIPASMTKVPALICMGRIVDADYLYINGQIAGNTAYQYPQRRYFLPVGILKPGRNLIVIRVINYSGKGGFVPDKPYYIVAAGDTVNLKGYWEYKVGFAFSPSREISKGISLQNQPTSLFNAMIAPITNYAVKGIIWYQGESNADNASEYEKHFTALINDWRKQWQQGNIPFLYLQLPNFMDVNYQPSESEWALVREGQLKALSLPNTGMAVTIDLGEWNDVHPGNKKDVGLRLGLLAEKIAYKENEIEETGPLYQSSEKTGNKIIIKFNHVGSGLVSRDGEPLRWFAIAGADKKFVWANAKIDGSKIVVWNDDIQSPIYVRYAWADNPRDVNFYNQEGLPASPFRTDK